MQLWEIKYDGAIYKLNYENLTADQKIETKGLIKYLNLEWEDECLFPQNNKRSVKTASQLQVRKKFIRSSQAWRSYEAFLNGALDQISM